MSPRTMQDLFRFLIKAFNELGASIPNDKLEELVVVIYSAMSSPSRNYHNLEHVFHFSNPEDPIISLAAVFHDLVYYQVDDGILPELKKCIDPFLRRDKDQFFLVDPIPSTDDRVNCLIGLFGFIPGQQITYREGLNEFLSALVAVQNLGGVIHDQDLFSMVLCIEATIPFRGEDPQGHGHFEVMADRLTRLRLLHPCLGSLKQIDLALKRAVIFSNKDVETFQLKDAGRFLEITFKLLPESNVALRKQGVYTIREYRLGLQKMESFLGSLNPHHVFNHYKDTPPAKKYANMVQRAQRNLETALRYIRIKLLAIGVLEGLAEATGGDAPLSLFVGDFPRELDIHIIEDENSEPLQIENFDPDADLVRLLSNDKHELGFELQPSPISLLIYKKLTESEQKKLFAKTQDFFTGDLSPVEFLALVPPRILSPVARAVGELVFTRQEKLMFYARQDR